MQERLKKHQISFKHAFTGLSYAFRTQPNFVIHFTLSILAILAGIILEISSLRMVGLIIMVAIGLAAEMINTAIESVTDLVANGWQKEAKIAKDVSAGMVLLTAMGAVLVACIILLPPLFERLGF
ncbi:MAG: diacylglycerol kinase family protein [bacterium]|nr:diacylglycerol kinase family protein [bacterium]